MSHLLISYDNYLVHSKSISDNCVYSTHFIATRTQTHHRSPAMQHQTKTSSRDELLCRCILQHSTAIVSLQTHSNNCHQLATSLTYINI